MTHLYFGIENLNLTNNQRNTLVAGLQALGNSNSDPQPCKRNHWRTRLDNQAAIFEADFDESTIDIQAIKNFLASEDVFNIDVATIGHSTQQTAYGRLATFSRLGTNYLRMISFGYNGGWSTWAVSNAAAQDYLADNIEAWDGE